jgi:hypothetical protein
MSVYGAESTGPDDAGGMPITSSKTTNAPFFTRSLQIIFFFHARTHAHHTHSDQYEDDRQQGVLMYYLRPKL